jgi:hypothetical protein
MTKMTKITAKTIKWIEPLKYSIVTALIQEIGTQVDCLTTRILS